MDLNISKHMPGWEIVRLIGEGSFGKVYEIVRNNFGIEEHCALKVISIPQSKAELQSIKNDGMDEDSITEYYRGLVEDFVQEIAMLSRLKGHQNIVSYEDYAVVEHEDGIGWDILIRMELLTDLPSYFNQNPLSEKDVVKLAIDICEALETCHAKKIIHRDIKIDNIFVSSEGGYKLGDFGVARNIEKTVSGLSKKGTYTYMAPEVYKGDAYNENVDIYSLGIVMYKLLNDNREPFLPPFPEVIKYSVKNEALVRRLRGETILPPSKASVEVGNVILKACAYNSEARYQKPSEMKMDLMSLLNKLELETQTPIVTLIQQDEQDASVSVVEEDEGTALLIDDDEGTALLVEDDEGTALLVEDEFEEVDASIEDEGTALLIDDDEGTALLVEDEFGETDVLIDEFGETEVLNQENDEEVEMVTQLDGSILYRKKEKEEVVEFPDFYERDYQTAVSKIENPESQQEYYNGIEILQSLAEDGYTAAKEYLNNIDNSQKEIFEEDEFGETDVLTKESEKNISSSGEAVSVTPDKKQSGKLKLSLLIVTACVILALIIGVIPAVSKQFKVKKACNLLNSGNFVEYVEIARDKQLFEQEKVVIRDIIRNYISQNDNYLSVDAGANHIVAVREDKSVVAVGANKYNQSDLPELNNVVAVAAGQTFTVLLGDFGYVYAFGNNDYGQCNVGEWKDIENIFAGNRYTVGLKTDGTVVATGENNFGQCNVEDWTDISLVLVGYNEFTVGLRNDGTVVATGDNSDGQCDVETWTDIATVSAGDNHTVGLKADGTVVATGNNDYGQCDVETWTDIVDVSACGNYTIGLKTDGTVVATGDNSDYQCEVESLSDIKAIAAGSNYSAFITNDSKVICIGNNSFGQCNTETWTNVEKILVSDNEFTVGLKTDGTLVATGDNENGQCNVKSVSNVICQYGGRPGIIY